VRRLTGPALAALAATATLAVPGVAFGDEIARPERATPVDAERGAVVWSAYDAAAGGFRLILAGVGKPARVLPARVSPDPFDADVGDDAQGRRVVVYTACPSGPASCNVRMIRVAEGTDESVPVAARSGVTESSPTISRGRLAWVTGGTVSTAGKRTRPHAWLSELGSDAAPIELPALPRRRCDVQFDDGPKCEAVAGTITDLELRGRTLAQAASTLHLDSRGGELRMVDLERRDSKQVLAFGAGEAGQALIGLSIDGRFVYTYKTCFGDPSGCFKRAGTIRYDLDRHRAELAADRSQLSGFSVADGILFRSEGAERLHCEIEQGSYPGVPGLKIGPCPIESGSLPGQWTPIRSAPTRRWAGSSLL